MKVAFPIYNKVIAATFDFASDLLVVTYKNKKILDKTTVKIHEPLPSLLATRLKNLNITTLVCGVISYPLATMIWHLNINVISGISGDIDSVLKAFLQSSNDLIRYELPGFRGRHWKGCCRRRYKSSKGIKTNL